MKMRNGKARVAIARRLTGFLLEIEYVRNCWPEDETRETGRETCLD
jgi:hypothetical protein